MARLSVTEVPAVMSVDAGGNIRMPGAVHVPLDRDSVAEACRALASEGVEAVAVCFLHAYRNPAHEKKAGEVLRRHLPDMHISLSCEVLPEMLEFERTSTTVVNAYVAPIIGLK